MIPMKPNDLSLDISEGNYNSIGVMSAIVLIYGPEMHGCIYRTMKRTGITGEKIQNAYFDYCDGNIRQFVDMVITSSPELLEHFDIEPLIVPSFTLK